MQFMLFALLSAFAFARRRVTARDRFNKDNDPVHYMRELEFRNTIDQYDLAIVLFFRKDVDDCKRMLPGFRYAAHKSVGRADFIAIAAKTAPDLCDELGVDKYPTVFSFRNGHLIENLENSTGSKQLYYYVKNVTKKKYTYVHEPSEAKPLFQKRNTSLVVAIPYVDARLDRLLSVAVTKYFRKLQILIATTPEVAEAFSIHKFPSISILRTQDDANVTFAGEPGKATVKSLTDFIDKNIEPRFEIMNSIDAQGDDLFMAVFFDTADKREKDHVKEILDRVSNDHSGAFKIRYGDAPQMRRTLISLNLQNMSTPIFTFLKKKQFGWQKWVFTGRPSALAVSAFVADQMRGRNTETVIDYPIAAKPKGLLKFMTGSELHDALEKQTDKDFVVNFVGSPCMNCGLVDDLFRETANWAHDHSIRSVVFARVNASCNDVPQTVWRNETFPYGWFFPARNRDAAFPIGKRRQLYWMVQLLKDNMTQPFKAQMPPKPERTPYVKREEL